MKISTTVTKDAVDEIVQLTQAFIDSSGLRCEVSLCAPLRRFSRDRGWEETYDVSIDVDSTEAGFYFEFDVERYLAAFSKFLRVLDKLTDYNLVIE